MLADLSIDMVPAAITVRGYTNPVIQEWNRAAENLYGYPAAEAVGRISHDLLASVFPLPLAELEKIVRVEGRWTGAVRQQRRDGTWVTVLARWELRCDAVGYPDSIVQVALEMPGPAPTSNPSQSSAEAQSESLIHLRGELAAGAGREHALEGTVARLELEEGAHQSELAAVAGREHALEGTVARLELEEGAHEGRLAAGAGREHALEGTVARVELEEGANQGRLQAGAGREHALEGTVARLELREDLHAAELKATIRELDAFAYSVSHDLRAPLRAINGFSQAIREDHAAALPEAALADLQRIERAASRMGALIDDLLRLSRLSRAGLTRRPVDLAALVREIAARTAAGSARTVSWEGPSEAWADADPGLIEVVLENLISNAWKFTAKRDEVVISFTVTESDEGRVYAIRDNGVGFEMVHAGKLFTPFHRLHSTRDFEGTGIGLAIVQRIVQRHGGRTWAKAEPGRGTAIHFTLPPPEAVPE